MATNTKIEKINLAIDVLQRLKNDEINEEASKVKIPEFEDDKILRPEAEKLAGVTQPTFDRLLKANRFRVHRVGRKQFFLRSEMLEDLKRND